VHRHLLGEPTDPARREHPVAHGKVGDLGAHRRHDPRHLSARGERQGRLELVEVLHHQHVGEVHPARVHVDHHLAGPGTGSSTTSTTRFSGGPNDSLVDGVVHSGSPADVDVDHVVALAEAWDSGATSWSFAERERFANDPLNLLVMTRETNRTKADFDAGEWKPPRRDAWCVTASMIILTKVAYSLTVDRAERDGLVEMARSCDRGGQRTVPSVPLPGSAEFEARARSVVARSNG
jgi:hypothetical protein